MQARIEFTQLAPPRTGLWCDSCALPSRIEIDWMQAVINPYSGAVLQCWTAQTETCPDCGLHRWKGKP